jgi:hypothetical protein
MNWRVTNLAAALAVVCSTIISHNVRAEEPDNPGNRGDYKLPEDPEAPVIVLDFKGGFTPPRISDEPTMTIRADGVVVIPKRFEGQKSFRGKISREELIDLLDFAVKENKFFEYDEAKVAEKLAKGGPRIAVADAATTVIKINAGGESKEVSHYALGMLGKGVEELQQLYAIQRRLMQVQSVVQMGGKEVVKKWLAAVNAELKDKFPAAPPLKVSDLASGGQRADGSLYVSFQRVVKKEADGPPAEVTSGFLNKPADGEPQINVNYRKL